MTSEDLKLVKRTKKEYGSKIKLWITFSDLVNNIIQHQLKTLFNQGLFDYFQDPNLL